MDINSIRKFFLGTKDRVHLDSAAVGISPDTARTSIMKFVNMVTEHCINDISQIHLAIHQARQDALHQISILLNTEQQNLALINNTSHGINIACNIIPWREKDEVIIADTEYLQVAIPFLKKQEMKSLNVVQLTANFNGCISLPDLQQKVSQNTKAICISSVQWCTGQRTFTKELGKFCKENNIWLIVDGVQEAGALRVDLKEKYCDFYIAGGHKWLNSPYGCGFIYMSDKAQKLTPSEFGYLNLKTPPDGWNSFFQDPAQTPFQQYSFPEVTRSFTNGGTGNAVGAIALFEAVKIVNNLGINAVENHILRLSELLRARLMKLNAEVTPLDHSETSGITIFRLPGGYTRQKTVLEALKRQKIFLSLRYASGHGGLRASTHYFNNEDDINALCEGIKSM